MKASSTESRSLGSASDSFHIHRIAEYCVYATPITTFLLGFLVVVAFLAERIFILQSCDFRCLPFGVPDTLRVTFRYPVIKGLD
jgi:hypothetical protein